MSRSFELNRYEAEVDLLEKRPLGKSVDVLLYGSSTFAFWGQENASKALFPFTVINNGFGGSTAEEAMHYFPRLVKPYTFKAIVLYEGDNDLVMSYSPIEVMDWFTKLIKEIKLVQPKAKIAILAIKYSPARKKIISLQRQLNQSLKQLALNDKNIFFISQEEDLFNKDGKLIKSLFLEDKLHFSSQGNLLMGNKIKLLLSSII